MKIRMGFVTNSSSTSFIIMTKDEMLEDDFLELMGVEKDSDFSEMVSELFVHISNGMTNVNEILGSNKYWGDKYSTVKAFLKSEFSNDVYQKYLDAIDQKRNVYVGELSSDGEGVLTSFVCCDHLIEENEKIYFNYANCYW